MIDRYFACRDCKTYIDAGGRWAYWTLEDAGILDKGTPISVRVVLSAGEYWNPDKGEDADWLYGGIFPTVSSFLKEHGGHRIIFGDKDDFLFGKDENYWSGYFDWMQVGYTAAPSPRSFVEEQGLRTWDEVCAHLAKLDREIWWMHDEKMRDAAKRKFKEVVESKSAS